MVSKGDPKGIQNTNSFVLRKKFFTSIIWIFLIWDPTWHPTWDPTWDPIWDLIWDPNFSNNGVSSRILFKICELHWVPNWVPFSKVNTFFS